MAGITTVCRKEISDHFGSKRFLILFTLIILLSTLSAYQGAEYLKNNPQAGFLAIFTGIQFGFSFVQLMVFFGPIIGLALGFDSINKERTSGTLSVLLSQPIFRDSVLNGKLLAGTIALATLTFSTMGIMCSVAIPTIGFAPTGDEASRIVVLAAFTFLYLAFWLSLGTLFSVLTKKTSTSILASVTIWLFCIIIVNILASLIANQMVPQPVQIIQGGQNMTDLRKSPEYLQIMKERFTIQSQISRISPTNLYSEAASAILGQFQRLFMGGGGPHPFRGLTLSQGFEAVWPNIVVLTVGLVVCFVASYIKFVRSEIRPGG